MIEDELLYPGIYQASYAVAVARPCLSSGQTAFYSVQLNLTLDICLGRAIPCILYPWCTLQAVIKLTKVEVTVSLWSPIPFLDQGNFHIWTAA